jgi:hypothetical protein
MLINSAQCNFTEHSPSSDADSHLDESWNSYVLPCEYTARQHDWEVQD